MNITENDGRDLVAEHSYYLERIEPIIRNRLLKCGVNEVVIDAYVAELPDEHFLVRINRAMASMRSLSHRSET